MEINIVYLFETNSSLMNYTINILFVRLIGREETEVIKKRLINNNIITALNVTYKKDFMSRYAYRSSLYDLLLSLNK